MRVATHKEAAHFLGYSQGTLANKNTQGKGPMCFKERGQLCYPYEGPNGLEEYKRRMRKPRMRLVRAQVEQVQLVLIG